MDAPLIHTIHGNVPVDSLSYDASWQVDAAGVVFVETYKDTGGAVVRRNVHVYRNQGLPALGAEQAHV